MENREFVRGYGSSTYRPLEGEPSSEIQHYSEGPRKWSYFFGELASDYLNGTVDDTNARELLREFYNWSFDHMPKTIRFAERSGTEENLSKQFLNSLNFHIMTASTLPMWLDLVDKNLKLDQNDYKDMQTCLAIESTKIALKRRALVEKESLFGEREELTYAYSGQLTEIDTMITGIEMVRTEKQADLSFLPAPSIFEDGHKDSYNIDFIVINKSAGEAHGIQAKTRVAKHPHVHSQTSAHSKAAVKVYDKERVAIIDGFLDLGNSGLDARRKVVAQPGLIALDHLQRITTKDKPRFLNEYTINDLMRAKGVARELSGKRKSYIAMATHHMRNKIQKHIGLDSK